MHAKEQTSRADRVTEPSWAVRGAWVAAVTALVAVSLCGLARAQSAAAPAAAASGPTDNFSFFITSSGSGKGADLGGLAGADAHCQELASAVGAGAKVWHAYLSTQATAGQPAVNARDRIGSGPWFNVQGVLVARDLSQLHGDTLDEARLGNGINWVTALTERGASVKRSGDQPNQHDILTGSLPDGRAYADSQADHTCHNYTSSAEDGSVQLGHFDRNGRVITALSWNSAHPSRGCSQSKLVSTGGAGLFYCFAVR